MHIKKNVFDNVIYTLLNDKEKSKDHAKARRDLQDMGIRRDLWVDENNECKPTAFAIPNNKKVAFLRTLKNISVPDGYSSSVSAKNFPLASFARGAWKGMNVFPPIYGLITSGISTSCSLRYAKVQEIAEKAKTRSVGIDITKSLDIISISDWSRLITAISCSLGLIIDISYCSDSSQPSPVGRDSSQPSLIGRNSSQPSPIGRNSSQPSPVGRDS
ncbi:hypothetical protein T459_15851 [Capsicum annuum]|uniref:Uncharacterized protein n=1 Tax=Capsicum annuum TaxID=4072 RepID=A0A2G2Z750_CAPAN|nr:hypothetical protein T459_15851 [Capsicum annuum]